MLTVMDPVETHLDSELVQVKLRLLQSCPLDHKKVKRVRKSKQDLRLIGWILDLRVEPVSGHLDHTSK